MFEIMVGKEIMEQIHKDTWKMMNDPEADKARSEMFLQWLNDGSRRILADHLLPELQLVNITNANIIPAKDLVASSDTDEEISRFFNNSKQITWYL